MQDRILSSKKTRWDLTFLAGLLLLVYAPMLWSLPIPTTGDQKTYLAQAFEMARAGHWFEQTLFGEPNYFKGPLLFLLLRLGLVLFGPTPAAMIYMNLLGFVAAVPALYLLVRRFLPRERAIALLVPAAVILSCGGYAHALASQMEALLIAAYAVFMALIGLAKPGAAGQTLRRAAWLVAGLAGLLKSPLHSVLLGTSALLFWLMTAQLKDLLRRRGEWLSVLLGITLCGAFFAPAFYVAPKAFVSTYIVREHLSRSGNTASLWDSLVPFFSGHLAPWLPLFLVATGAAGWDKLRGKGKGTAASTVLWRLSLAMLLPTAVFFAFNSYHNDVYFLPLLAPLMLIMGLGLGELQLNHPRLTKAAFSSLFVTGFLVSAALVAIILRLAPFPAWWGRGTTVILYAMLALSLTGFVLSLLQTHTLARMQLALAALACLFVAGGRLLQSLNAHEESAFATVTAAHPEAPWARLNLNKNVWTDSGFLSIMLHHPVTSIESEVGLLEALRAGQLVLVPDAAQLAAVRTLATKTSGLDLMVEPYSTWRIHGMVTNGETAWASAWRQRRLDPLEQTEYAVSRSQPVVPTQALVAPTPERNVILITWDGVRIDEFLEIIKHDPHMAPNDYGRVLPYLWTELAPRGQVYGDQRQWQFMTVGNPDMVSLPGYEGIFGGVPPSCHNNDCDRITTETFPERLRRDLHLARSQVAAFGSWETLPLAVEATPGTIYSDFGLDGPSSRDQGEKPPPWAHARYDAYTWRHAMDYFVKERPRFFFIGLNDTDEHGHWGLYENYVNKLRTYDSWLKELVTQLESMGDYGRNTCLVITSDHGRGLGDQWVSHSANHPYSAFTMLYMGCPLSADSVHFRAPTTWTTHLAIRPTIEALFGLEPQACLMCASSLLEPQGPQPTTAVARSPAPAPSDGPVRTL